MLTFSVRFFELKIPSLLLKQLALLVVLCVLCHSASANEPVSKSRIAGVAIGGKDSVAYHELKRSPQEAAVSGQKTYTVNYKGAKWRFLSKKSADLFRANPEKYEPAYNGHCANALSIGNGLVKTDGTHWEILGEKLYLFYAGAGRARWLDGSWETYKQAADAAWLGLSQ